MTADDFNEVFPLIHSYIPLGEKFSAIAKNLATEMITHESTAVTISEYMLHDRNVLSWMPAFTTIPSTFPPLLYNWFRFWVGMCQSGGDVEVPSYVKNFLKEGFHISDMISDTLLDEYYSGGDVWAVGRIAVNGVEVSVWRWKDYISWMEGEELFCVDVDLFQERQVIVDGNIKVFNQDLDDLLYHKSVYFNDT
jgi:hypothetical protein